MKISAQYMYVVSNSVRHLKIRRLNACRRQIGVVGGKIVVCFFLFRCHQLAKFVSNYNGNIQNTLK